MNINATLFGQMLTFGIFVWVTCRYVWPPLEKALRAREDTIASGLQAAERGQQQLLDAQNDAKAVLDQARDQASTVLQEAQHAAQKLLSDAKAQGEAEKARIIASADGEMAVALEQARQSLMGEVVDLAMLGAKRVVGEHLDAQAQDAARHGALAELEASLRAREGA